MRNTPKQITITVSKAIQAEAQRRQIENRKLCTDSQGKVTEYAKTVIADLIRNGSTITEISRVTGLSIPTILNIKQGMKKQRKAA